MKILQQFDLLIQEWRRDLFKKAMYPSDMLYIKEKYLGKHGKVAILKHYLDRMPKDERAYLKKHTDKLEQEMQKAYNMRMSDMGLQEMTHKLKLN